MLRSLWPDQASRHYTIKVNLNLCGSQKPLSKEGLTDPNLQGPMASPISVNPQGEPATASGSETHRLKGVVLEMRVICFLKGYDRKAEERKK